jgi:hypothetical protein
MKQYTQKKDFCTEKSESWSVLEQIAREGARKMLHLNILFILFL